VKEEVDQIIVPLPMGRDLADRLAVLLRELVPPDQTEVVAVDPDAAAVAAAEAVAAGFGPRRAPTI
jgi:ketosteroid isomerase-like protein